MVRLLCWFVHKHLEFREPELRALCEMHGVPLQLAPPVELEPEPEPDAGAPPQSRGTATALPPDSVLRLADFPDEDTAARIGSRASGDLKSTPLPPWLSMYPDLCST